MNTGVLIFIGVFVLVVGGACIFYAEKEKRKAQK